MTLTARRSTDNFHAPVAPLRPGFRIVFIVGPVRCGTTWLHQMLSKCTQCSYLPAKEIYYFAQDAVSVSRNDYLSKYTVRGETYVDVSPTYFPSSAMAAQIAEMFPGSTVVIIKRQPAEIAVSQYLYMRRHGAISSGFTEFMTSGRFRALREGFRYAANVRHWARRFPRGQLVFVDYEHFVRDPSAYFTELCAQIGVRIVGSNVSPHRINRSTGAPRSRTAYRGLVALGRSLQRIIPREALLRFKTRIFDRWLIDDEAVHTITEDEMALARDYYSVDAEFLRTL